MHQDFTVPFHFCHPPSLSRNLSIDIIPSLVRTQHKPAVDRDTWTSLGPSIFILPLLVPGFVYARLVTMKSLRLKAKERLRDILRSPGRDPKIDGNTRDTKTDKTRRFSLRRRQPTIPDHEERSRPHYKQRWFSSVSVKKSKRCREDAQFDYWGAQGQKDTSAPSTSFHRLSRSKSFTEVKYSVESISRRVFHSFRKNRVPQDPAFYQDAFEDDTSEADGDSSDDKSAPVIKMPSALDSSEGLAGTFSDGVQKAVQGE